MLTRPWLQCVADYYIPLNLLKQNCHIFMINFLTERQLFFHKRIHLAVFIGKNLQMKCHFQVERCVNSFYGRRNKIFPPSLQQLKKQNLRNRLTWLSNFGNTNLLSIWTWLLTFSSLKFRVRWTGIFSHFELFFCRLHSSN